MAAVFDGSEKEDHFYEFATVVEDDVFVGEMEEEARADAFEFPRDHCFDAIAEILQSVCL